MTGITGVSLFAGVGGIDEALRRAGVNVTAAVEIDPDCRSVLARHFPHTTLFDDVRTVTGEQLRATGFVPGRGILAFGWPCQDMSIAGLRTGLGGTRSGLFWEAMRLADELSPRWLLAENVPGLLSSVCSCPGDNSCTFNGRTVRCGEWRGDPLHREWFPGVPHGVSGGACPGGCMAAHGGAMGTVLGALGERGYGFAYRMLDAQFFGVPQRRERVFIAGCLGDWAAPVQVLLEPESSEGDFAACGPAGTGAARRAPGGTGSPSTAGTLAGTGPGGGWRVGADEAAAGQLVASSLLSSGGRRARPEEAAGNQLVVSTLQGGGRRGHRVDAEGAAGGHLIPLAPLPSRAVSHALTAREGKGADSDATSGFILAMPVAMRGREAGSQIEYGQPGEPAFTIRTPGGGSSYPMVAHALTSEGADASEDGTGRSQATSGVPRPVPSSLAATLTSGRSASDGVNPPGRRQEDDVNLVAVPIQDGRSMTKAQNGLGIGAENGSAYTLDTTGAQAVAMAFNPQSGGSKARIGYGEKPTALQSSQVTGVQTATAVRRLTPRECERLQGFPDDWTRWRADGREQSDSARYRQIGNAVAVPVVEWIARRIVAVAGMARKAGGAA